MFVNIFKLQYLRNQWSNCNQILSEAMLKKLLVWHCRPGGSQVGSVDRIFFFFFYITKKSWKFLLQICLKCKLNCMQNSPMIYSDTTVFLRIACSNTKHLCRSRYMSNKTYDCIRNGFSDVLHFATGVALQCVEICALFTFAVQIVRRLHSPEKKSVLIKSKRPIDL